MIFILFIFLCILVLMYFLAIDDSSVILLLL